MNNSTAFVIIAFTEYEGSTPIRVAFSEREANEFKAECVAHESLRPAPLEDWVGDTPEQEAIFDKWNEDCRQWRGSHPGGGEASSYDSFKVEEVLVIDWRKGPES